MNENKTFTHGYFNEDCIAGMKRFPDKYFDLAIVDPPYFAQANLKYGFAKPISTTGQARKDYHISTSWEIPTQEYYDELCRVSKNQIIWGINYFEFVGVPHGRIVWDKQKAMQGYYSDAEIASCSLLKHVRTFRYTWDGMRQGDMKNKEDKIHITQKPVALYMWLLNTYAKPGDKILDTHVGSASSLIACHRLGFEYVGFELDPHYYKISRERLDAEKSQVNIVDIIEKKTGEQLELLGGDT